LDNADLSGADMIGAMFENMDFSKVNLDAAHMAKTLADMDMKLRDIIVKHGEWVKTNGKKGKRADLSKMDLSGESLQKVNLLAADLSFTVLKGANLSKSEFLMTDFSFADLRGAVLARADLRGVKMMRANLTGATMVGVVLSEVSISMRAGAGEWRASLEKATLRGAMLNGAVMKNMDMEGADFREADLRDADLSGSMLMDADFTDADLRGTKLDKTDQRGAKGLPKKFEEDEK